MDQHRTGQEGKHRSVTALEIASMPRRLTPPMDSRRRLRTASAGVTTALVRRICGLIRAAGLADAPRRRGCGVSESLFAASKQRLPPKHDVNRRRASSSPRANTAAVSLSRNFLHHFVVQDAIAPIRRVSAFVLGLVLRSQGHQLGARQHFHLKPTATKTAISPMCPSSRDFRPSAKSVKIRDLMVAGRDLNPRPPG